MNDTITVLAGTESARLSALDSKLDFWRLTREPIFVFHPSWDTVRKIARPADAVWQKPSEVLETDLVPITIDIAREYRVRGDSFAQALMSDAKWGSNTDPFWQTVAKLAVQGVYQVAGYSVIMNNKVPEPDDPMPSFTREYMSVLEDLMCSISASGGTRRGSVEEPPFLEDIPEDTKRLVKSLILSNSTVTASCIMSILFSASECLRRNFLYSDEDTHMELLYLTQTPIHICCEDTDPSALSLFYHLDSRKKVAVEIQDLPRELQKNEYDLSTSKDIPVDADLTFLGHTRSSELLDFFEKLKEKAGVHILHQLPVENLMYLGDGEFISHRGGTFSLEHSTLLRNSNLSLKVTERGLDNPWGNIYKDYHEEFPDGISEMDDFFLG